MEMQRAIIVVSNTSNQTEHQQHGIKLLLKIVSELLVLSLWRNGIADKPITASEGE